MKISSNLPVQRQQQQLQPAKRVHRAQPDNAPVPYVNEGEHIPQSYTISARQRHGNAYGAQGKNARAAAEYENQSKPSPEKRARIIDTFV